MPSEDGKDSEMMDEDEVEEVDSDEWEEENPIEDNNCLFCLHHSRNLVKNLHHMMKAHTFFIPDIEYCVDLPGLLTYLGEKVSKGLFVSLKYYIRSYYVCFCFLF